MNNIDFEEAYQLLKEQVKKDNHILGCDCSKKDKEIERLNNIINKLEKVFIECDYQHLQRKLKSLKEDNKE